MTTHLRLAGLVDVLTFPGAAIGGSLALALVFRPRWRLELGGLLVPEQTFDVEPPAKITFGLAGGSLRGCYQPIAAQITLATCLGFEAASETAAGSGTAIVSRSRSVAWLGPNLALLLLWQVSGPVALAAVGEGAAPWMRREFSIREMGEVHQWPVVTLRGGVGVEVTLP